MSDCLFKTKQEYLDGLVKASKDGTFPSATSMFCKYRIGDKKCAIGITIPNEIYKREMESIGNSNDLYEKYPSLLPDWASKDEMRTIQQIHDSMTETWNHNQFVDQLLSTNLFLHMKPLEV